MKIGSLCTGYGGLDLAVETFFDAETVWCAETDKYASHVITKRFTIPNYGDIKAIDWGSVEPIDILTAGYPCQPFSHAGQRKGKNDERHLWPYILEAISVLHPRIVVLENVRGHISLGMEEVLKGLASNGYDAKWSVVRASDVGAPHQRARIFIIAYSNSYAHKEPRRTNSSIYGQTSKVINRPDWHEYGCGCQTSDTDNQHKPHNRQVQKLGRRFTSRCQMPMQTPPNALAEDKLNSVFVEYMMGLPVGWVTDCDLSNAQTMKLLGNGVVPQQAYYALELLTK
jgi:DNA (cytosine-5)-methyltransferase 1